MSACAIEAEGLVRRFGPAAALRGVSLRVGWGERAALLGPNGAGKTTLLKVLATLLRPTAGRASAAGYDVVGDGAAVRRAVGFAGHQHHLYDDLTVEENLAFYGSLFGVPAPGRRAEEVLGRCGLWARRRQRVRALSRGLQQRAAIARALLHDPAVLLLDEPDTGLDEAGLRWLAATLAEEGRTVLIATHAADHARAWCDRVIVLVEGAVAYDGPAAGP